MIKHRPELPHLPHDMIEEVYKSLDARQNVNTHSGTDPEFVYEYMSATDSLVDWCKKNIDHTVDWAVQYIHGSIPAHADWAFDEHKLNYLVDLGGGQPATHWFDLDGKIIYTANCELGWYELTVNIPHTVEHVSGRRISVTHRSRRDTLADRAGLTRDDRDVVKDYGYKL